MQVFSERKLYFKGETVVSDGTSIVEKGSLV